jgi:hypothetical protein
VLQDIWVDRAAPTNQLGQILIAASLQQPFTDGTDHFYDFNVLTGTRIEFGQLGKTAVYSEGLGSDGVPLIQDHIEAMNLSVDGHYLMYSNWAPNFIVVDMRSGHQITSFQGSRPQWLGDSHTFVDIVTQDDLTEVYSLDVDTGTRTTLFESDQPFSLIVP